MIGFHIDMNMAQYSADYLRRWLRQLARRGYDTILWEVENNIAWDTCPECVSPDAFKKDEFRTLLKECRELGLEPVPLLQTIGHAEYVLKHNTYASFKELPDHIDQYCPRNPDVISFLSRWIDEYLEVFGEVKYFHLGADEAWILGSCPLCQEYASRTSLSRLYIDHINPLAAKIARHRVTPIIWADMVLHYPEALNLLSRDIMLFDWMYDVYRGSGKVMVWGQGRQTKEEFSTETRERYLPFLFPLGEEPGREPETFYTADYLAAQGFKVVTCPASSSFRDNVFTPRTWLHLVNTFDSFHKGLSSHLEGSLLTSWSVHLHPWEVQLPVIDLPGYIDANPDATIADYQEWWGRYRFGCQPDSFWKACGLVSPSCLFTHTRSLGFHKDCQPVPRDHIQKTILKITESNQVDREVESCQKVLEGYQQAARLLTAFQKKARKGEDLLQPWYLAAQNLVNRASVSVFLLKNADAILSDRLLKGAENHEGTRLLEEMRELRTMTDRSYRAMIKPTRRDEMIEYMYGAVENALLRLTGNAPL